MKYTQETVGGWVTYEDHERDFALPIWKGLLIIYVIIPLICLICFELFIGLIYLLS